MRGFSVGLDEEHHLRAGRTAGDIVWVNIAFDVNRERVMRGLRVALAQRPSHRHSILIQDLAYIDFERLRDTAIAGVLHRKPYVRRESALFDSDFMNLSNHVWSTIAHSVHRTLSELRGTVLSANELSAILSLHITRAVLGDGAGGEMVRHYERDVARYHDQELAEDIRGRCNWIVSIAVHMYDVRLHAINPYVSRIPGPSTPGPSRDISVISAMVMSDM